jgi:hypothetical protein
MGTISGAFGPRIYRFQVRFISGGFYSVIETSAPSSTGKQGAIVVVEAGTARPMEIVEIPISTMPGFGLISTAAGQIVLNYCQTRLVVGVSGSKYIDSTLVPLGYVHLQGWV